MSVGRRIASMRKFRDLTQDQLGAKLDVSKQTISGWENDYRTPNGDDIRALCKLLGCTADYLLELSDNPNENIKW